MGYFYDPEKEARDIAINDAAGRRDAEEAQHPLPPPPPGLFDNFWNGVGTGVQAGALNTANALLTTGEQGIKGLGNALNMPGLKRTPAQESLANTLEELQRTTRANALEAVPDESTGTAGHIAYGLSKIGTEALLSSAVGIPAPLGIGTAEGIATSDQAEAHGIDANTATRMGLVSGISNATFASLPGTVGIQQLVPDFLASVGLNELVGMADRGANAKLLDDAGYHAMADTYHVWDTQAMAANVGLTALFHGVARHQDYGQAFQQFADNSRFMPGNQRDMALATETARHVDTDLAPGIPTTPTALSAHMQAIAEIDAAVREGRPPDPDKLDLSKHVYVANPAHAEFNESAKKAIDELHAEYDLPNSQTLPIERLPEPLLPVNPPPSLDTQAVDPNTPFEILQAERLLRDHPTMTDLEDNAALVEVMREHDKEIEQAKELGEAVDAVASCAMRYGS